MTALYFGTGWLAVHNEAFREDLYDRVDLTTDGGATVQTWQRSRELAPSPSFRLFYNENDALWVALVIERPSIQFAAPSPEEALAGVIAGLSATRLGPLWP